MKLNAKMVSHSFPLSVIISLGSKTFLFSKWIIPLENLVENGIASLNKKLINTTINLLIIGRGEILKTLSVLYIKFIGILFFRIHHLKTNTFMKNIF